MTPYYKDASVTIYHGEALAMLAQMETASVDALVTDPPYSSGGAFRTDRVKAPDEKYRGWTQLPEGGSRAPTAEYGSFSGDNRDQRTFAMWSSLWASEAFRICRPSSQAFVFTDWRQLPTVTDVVQLGGWAWRGLIVWDKGVARPNKGRFRNHLEYVVWASHGGLADVDGYPSALVAVPTVSPEERQHVTQKPARLFEHLLSLTPTKGILLDPFMGSGSSLRAAKDSGWRAIGIEIEERYCEIAAERCRQQVLDLSNEGPKCSETVPMPEPELGFREQDVA